MSIIIIMIVIMTANVKRVISMSHMVDNNHFKSKKRLRSTFTIAQKKLINNISISSASPVVTLHCYRYQPFIKTTINLSPFNKKKQTTIL